MMTRLRRDVALAGVLLLSGALAGCAANALKQARAADELREYDVAVAQYQKAVRDNPKSKEAQLGLERSRLRASDAHLFRGRRLFAQGRYDDALVELQLAVELNPTNGQGESELRAVRSALRAKLSAPAEGQTRLESVLARTRDLPPAGYELPNVKLPTEITTGASMTSRLLYLMLAKLTSISVTFDSQFRDAAAQVSLLSGMTLKQALDAIAKSTSTFYQVMGPTTIIVAPDTPAKRREYQEDVFGWIYVQNADLKETMDALRVVGDLRSIAPITNLNAIGVRDTAERLLAARRFVAAFDKALPEVVVDVEVLEVNRSRVREYGLQFASPGTTGISGTLDANRDEGLTLRDLRSLTAADVLASNIPVLYYRLLKTDDRTRTLANPHIRILDGTTATANFGEEVPVPRTTIAPITQGGINIQPQTTFDYKKVGVNIGITPRTHSNDEVTLRLTIELSTVSGTGFDGLPKFGSRNVQTTIRLKDGQTNILAGLIRDDERAIREGDFPIIGHLFARNRKEAQQTDVVVMLTPHIIRELSLTEEDLRPFKIPRDGSGVALSEGTIVPPPPIIRGGGGDTRDVLPSLPISVGVPTGLPLAPLPAPPKVIKNWR